MAIIKAKSTFDSFNVAPEGKNVYVFTGEVKPTSNNSLMFVAEYENDPTCKVNVFGGVNNQNGMENLMGIIVCSGVGNKMRKKKPALSDPSEGWDEAVLKNPAMIEQLKVDIAGCKIMLEVYHKPSSWTNDAGEKKVGVNANCREMFPVESGGGGQTEKPVAMEFE